MLCAQRHSGDKRDRSRRESVIAELHRSWPIRAVPVSTKRHWLDRGGDRQGDAHALRPACNLGRLGPGQCQTPVIVESAGHCLSSAG